MIHQPKTSGTAIWSLIFGILSNTCLWILGSIPAIILGVMAIRKVDQSGGALTGRGIGIAGIVTGGAGVILGTFPVAVLSSIVMPAYLKLQERDDVAKHQAQMTQVILACSLYAAEHGGNHPPSLDHLTQEGYLDDGTLLHLKTAAERRSGARGSALLYRSGLSDSSFSGDPLIAAPAPNGLRRLVGRVDGSVVEMPEWEYQERYATYFR